MPRRHWLPLLLLAGLALRLGFTVALHGDWALLEQGPVLCPVKLMTGVPCPGCGMTRATIACAMGAWSRAWAYHPLAVPFWGMLVAAGVRAWIPDGWITPLLGRYRGSTGVAPLVLAGVILVWLERLAIG